MTGTAAFDRVSVNTYVLRHLPFSAMVADLRARGLSSLTVHYDQVLRDTDARATLERCGIAVSCVVVPNRSVLADSSSRTKSCAELVRAVDMAASLGAPLVYTTSGSAVGMSWDEAVGAATTVLAPAVERSRASEIAFLVENTSPMRPDFGFAHTLTDTVDFALSVGCGICADLGTCWTDRDLPSVLANAWQSIGLVQISDFRLGTTDVIYRDVPGDGVAPLSSLLRTLMEVGYVGPIDVELNGPRVVDEGPADAMRRAAAWVQEQLDEVHDDGRPAANRRHQKWAR